MKTRLSFMVLPILLLLVGSTGGLFKILIENSVDAVDSTTLIGKWTAYEYYDNNIHPKGLNQNLDFSKVNQISNLIEYESQEDPCPSKISEVEQKMEYFKIKFMENGKAEILEKLYFKMNSYNSKCQNAVYDESYDQVLIADWDLDLKNATLNLRDSLSDSQNNFKIYYLDKREMHLALKKDQDFIFVKLQKQ